MKLFGYCSFLVIIAVCEARYVPGQIPDFYAMVEPHLKAQIPKYIQKVARYIKFGVDDLEAIQKNISIAETSLSDQLNTIFKNFPEDTLKAVQETTGTQVRDGKALSKQVEIGVSKLINNFLKSFGSATEGIKTLKADLATRESLVDEVIKKEIPKLINDFVEKMKPEESKTVSQKYVDDLKGPGRERVVADARQQFQTQAAITNDVINKVLKGQIVEANQLAEGLRSLVDQVAEDFVEEDKKAAVKNELAEQIVKKYIVSSGPALQKGLKAVYLAYSKVQEAIADSSNNVVDEVDYELKRLTNSISVILMSTFDY